MNYKELLWTCLSEEAGETSQAVGKIARFGEDNVDPANPDQGTNIDRCIREINDQLAVLELLEETGIDTSRIGNRQDIEEKKARLRSYMQKSVGYGTLTQKPYRVR
jgi:hypothetical protein